MIRSVGPLGLPRAALDKGAKCTKVESGFARFARSTTMNFHTKNDFKKGKSNC